MKCSQFDIRDFTEPEYGRYYALMTAEKRGRVDRFRFPDDKKRTVAGDMLARRAVAEWCGVPEDRVVFDLGPHGKPFARGLEVEFSISHSGSLAVCAADSAPVGIDVELIQPVNLSIARRVCTPEELLFLFGRAPEPSDFSLTGDPVYLDRFYEIWTQKEAYAKYTGLGLAQLDAPRPGTGYQTLRQGDYIISIYQPAEP